MKNAILLHGRPTKAEYYDSAQPSASNAHWFAWLQKQLLVHDIKADTPEVPFAFDPQWDLWVKEAERFEIGPETIVVGHSTGGGFWVRYLAEHPELTVAKVILVAPWLNVKHEDDIDFFDFSFTPEVIKQAGEFVIFSSDNDDEDIQNTVVFLREQLPGVTYREFHNYGHFTLSGLGKVEFPELLEECLKA
jgi:uncharacterized protein